VDGYKVQVSIQELEEQRSWALTRAATIRSELSQKIRELEIEIGKLKKELEEIKE